MTDLETSRPASAKAPAPKPRVERIWANLALIVGLGTVLIAVIRVYAWSGYYVPVALAVLSVADRTTLLASTLLLVLIGLVPLGLSELVFSERLSITELRKTNRPLGQVVGSLAVIYGLGIVIFGFATLSILLPLGGVLALLAIGWIVVAIVWRVRHGRGAGMKVLKAPLFGSVRGPWPTVVALSTSVMIGVLGQPWMPLETISRIVNPEVIVGYVVGTQNDFTLVLDQSKSPVWIASSDIASRQLCSRDPYQMWDRTIADLLSPTFLPMCP